MAGQADRTAPIQGSRTVPHEPSAVRDTERSFPSTAFREWTIRIEHLYASPSSDRQAMIDTLTWKLNDSSDRFVTHQDSRRSCLRGTCDPAHVNLRETSRIVIDPLRQIQRNTMIESPSDAAWA